MFAYRDPQLAAKMGQALQKTHLYRKAINYYKEAIKTEEDSLLRYDMAGPGQYIHHLFSVCFS